MLNNLNMAIAFELMVTFIMCLIGAALKDIYNSLKSNNEEKVKLAKILVSSTISSIIVYSLSDYIYKYNPKFYLLVAVITGTLGFEIMGVVSNLKNWLIIVKKNIRNIDISDIEIDEDKDNKKDK